MILTAPYTADDNTIFLPGTNVALETETDNCWIKTVDVNIRFTSNTVDAVRGVGSFTYVETWEDADVWNFVATKMSIE